MRGFFQLHISTVLGGGGQISMVPLTFFLALVSTCFGYGFNEQLPLSSTSPLQPRSRFEFHHPVKRVAVIGAGPAGLQAAAALVEHKHRDGGPRFVVRLFERAPGPGGNWFYTEETPVREAYPDKPIDEEEYIPPTHRLPFTKYYKDGEEGVSLEDRWTEHWQPRPVWHSLHTNSPAVITELPDVPYPPDSPWVISNHQIQRHVRAYASVHALNVNDEAGANVTSYSTRVEKLEKLQETQTWRLTLRKLEKVGEGKGRRVKATWWTEDFDAVVIATGPYVAPHVPEIEGIVDWSHIKGEGGRWSIWHSQAYRRPERLAGKNILIVGASVSASEIARDISPFVKTVRASIRPHKNLHPFQLRSRLRFPDNAEFIPEIKQLLPLGAHDKGIHEGKIELIILATGYRRENRFLPNTRSDGQPEKLHWTGHFIPDPTLAYTNVRPWTIGKHQSYAFAKVWEGTAHLPPQEEMQADYDNGKYQFRGLFSSIQAETLARQYVAWLNNESLINGGRLVEPWPLQNREVFVYYSDVEWIQGYAKRSNFTDAEHLPASEWPTGSAAWNAIVYDDEGW
ncbi:Dimethylaniline monooxygenase [Mycena kentingensis (nom. inval.)]|nr:Dimethylaniline monooxygenase [Mycena kentingensis (nom. inval.)]